MKKGKRDFIKSTLIGGIFFLIPLTAVVLIADKLVDLMRGVASQMPNLLSVDTPLGTLLLILLALLVILAICFLAGVIAQGPHFKRVHDSLDAALSALIPSFSFIRAFGDNVQSSEQYAEGFIPVLVQFDDYSQIAFEIERDPDGGKVALYLPGAPSPWSGTVAYVAPERVRHLSMSLREALTNIRMLGKGSLAYSKRTSSD